MCLNDLNSDEGAIVRIMWEYSSTGTFKNIHIYAPSGAMRCVSKAKYLLFRSVPELRIMFSLEKTIWQFLERIGHLELRREHKLGYGYFSVHFWNPFH